MGPLFCALCSVSLSALWPARSCVSGSCVSGSLGAVSGRYVLSAYFYCIPITAACQYSRAHTPYGI